MRKTKVLLSLAVLAIPLAAGAESDNWPTFRGADALNVSADSEHRLETVDSRPRLVVSGGLAEPCIRHYRRERR